VTTDTSERGLERLICTALTGTPCDPGTRPVDWVKERPSAYGAAADSEEMVDAG
jgi:type I restriction enzyme, R subunit